MSDEMEKVAIPKSDYQNIWDTVGRLLKRSDELERKADDLQRRADKTDSINEMLFDRVGFLEARLLEAAKSHVNILPEKPLSLTTGYEVDVEAEEVEPLTVGEQMRARVQEFLSLVEDDGTPLILGHVASTNRKVVGKDYEFRVAAKEGDYNVIGFLEKYGVFRDPKVEKKSRGKKTDKSLKSFSGSLSNRVRTTAGKDKYFVLHPANSDEVIMELYDEFERGIPVGDMRPATRMLVAPEKYWIEALDNYIEEETKAKARGKTVPLLPFAIEFRNDIEAQNNEDDWEL